MTELLCARLPSGALRVTGADRVDFVQGQMTGDVRGAAVPSVTAGCFLNVRGQIEQFAYVYRRQGDLYLHTSVQGAPALLERFRRYIIFDQVTLEDLSDELKVLHLWGALPAAWLPEPGPRPGAAAWELLWGDARVLLGAVNRTGQPGLDLQYLARQEPQVMAELARAGLQEVPLDELHRQRIRAGVPDVDADGWTGVLPQEVGLDVGGPLPAISYRKGCYVGQEIMARVEARGQVRYGLVPVRLAAGDGAATRQAPDLTGAEVRQGEKVVGRLGLVSDSHALARLRTDMLPGAPLHVAGWTVTPEQPASAPTP